MPRNDVTLDDLFDTQLRDIEEGVRKCHRCKLAPGCSGAVATQAVPGDGGQPSDLMIISEAPGADEDKTGKPFVGASGQYLWRQAEKADLPVRDSSRVYITNVVKHRPPGNRKPERDEIRACRKWLEKEIAAVRPKVILLLGATAREAVLNKREVAEAAENKTFVSDDGTVYVCTHHPAFVMLHATPEQRREFRKALRTTTKLLKELDA